uniref:Uncharacterized protein n=1 Tax=Anopheles coluzzii TaxID=1518534 RepID=A0A8W7PD30_ANOCL
MFVRSSCVCRSSEATVSRSWASSRTGLQAGTRLVQFVQLLLQVVKLLRLLLGLTHPQLVRLAPQQVELLVALLQRFVQLFLLTLFIRQRCLGRFVVLSQLFALRLDPPGALRCHTQRVLQLRQLTAQSLVRGGEPLNRVPLFAQLLLEGSHMLLRCETLLLCRFEQFAQLDQLATALIQLLNVVLSLDCRLPVLLKRLVTGVKIRPQPLDFIARLEQFRLLRFQRASISHRPLQIRPDSGQLLGEPFHFLFSLQPALGALAACRLEFRLQPFDLAGQLARTGLSTVGSFARRLHFSRYCSIHRSVWRSCSAIRLSRSFATVSSSCSSASRSSSRLHCSCSARTVAFSSSFSLFSRPSSSVWLWKSSRLLCVIRSSSSSSSCSVCISPRHRSSSACSDSAAPALTHSSSRAAASCSVSFATSSRWPAHSASMCFASSVLIVPSLPSSVSSVLETFCDFRLDRHQRLLVHGLIEPGCRFRRGAARRCRCRHRHD